MRIELQILGLLIFFCGFTSAAADMTGEDFRALQTSGASWFCSLSTELKGEHEHFFRYGRDSWTGQAIMNCDSGRRKISKTVEVAFQSTKEGFGADEKSRLQIAVALTSLTEPDSIVETAVGSDPTESGLVLWRIEKIEHEILATVETSNLPGVVRSTSEGKISLRDLHRPAPLLPETTSL